MTSLKEDAKLALEMWESWNNLEAWGLNPRLDTDDSRIVDVNVQYRVVFVLVNENIADLHLQTEISNLHRKEPVPNWNEATFWNWYEYWLSIFKGTKPTPTKLKLSTFVADDVRMQDALQQYTCAVLSHYLNIKYGLCILAATYPKQEFPFKTENLVERLGWTATMQKDQAKVQAPFMVSQIYAYVILSPELKGKIYVTVGQAVVKMGKTIPQVLTLPPLKADPPKPPNVHPPKPPTPTDGGGGMGILFIVLLLLAAAVTFSKK